jgi:quinol monooxygenase YgiN
MLVRIVKMTFDPEKISEFLSNFDKHKLKIRHFPGCNRLELLRDQNKSNIFFTYSYWDSSEDLDKYRQSELFKKVWSKTKILFVAKPEAWSVDKVVVLPENANQNT